MDSDWSVLASFLACGIGSGVRERWSDILSVGCSVVAFACRKGLAPLFGRIALVV